MGDAYPLKQLLPLLLKDLSNIRDFRNPKKLKHRLSMLMAYGILMFVYQMCSRREANKTMTMPIFKENLKRIVPEFEDMSHHDTINRLLERIDDVGYEPYSLSESPLPPIIITPACGSLRDREAPHEAPGAGAPASGPLMRHPCRSCIHIAFLLENCFNVSTDSEA